MPDEEHSSKKKKRRTHDDDTPGRKRVRVVIDRRSDFWTGIAKKLAGQTSRTRPEVPRVVWELLARGETSFPDGDRESIAGVAEFIAGAGGDPESVTQIERVTAIETWGERIEREKRAAAGVK